MARHGLPDRRPVAAAEGGRDPAGPRRVRSRSRSWSASSRSRSASGRPIYLEEYARDTLRQPPAPNRTSPTLPASLRSSTGSSAWPSSSRALGLGDSLLAGGPDPRPADPADRHHRHDRGAQGRARLPARGGVRARRDALADGPRVGAAGGGARDHDRHHPRHGPGDRRGGAAHPRRRGRPSSTFLPQPFQAGLHASCRSRSSNGPPRPQADFQGIAAATIIVILVLMLILNGSPSSCAHRLSRHIQW